MAAGLNIKYVFSPWSKMHSEIILFVIIQIMTKISISEYLSGGFEFEFAWNIYYNVMMFMMRLQTGM